MSAVARGMVELAYQENNVLLPMCLNVLDEGEWNGIRDKLDETGIRLALEK